MRMASWASTLVSFTMSEDPAALGCEEEERVKDETSQ